MNVISLIITITVFLAVNFLYESIITTKSEAAYEEEIECNNIVEENLIIQEEEIENDNSVEENSIVQEEKKAKEGKTSKTIWTLEIPEIGLKAEIAEDTTEEVMNEYIGHFKDTSKWEGNVGLAAHNRRLSSELFWKT